MSLMQTIFPILHETLLSHDIETIDVLAINDDIYTSLINSLLKEDLSKTAQPKLIVGGAGCGKTFLIKRLQSTIKKECSKALYPIVIDGKSLYSTNDIWTQCASMLNIEENDDYFNGIIKWQECNLKRVVLFIDNIQYYFNRTDNAEHYALRGKINRSGTPILIASAKKVLPAFTDYNAAFFDGFKILYIKPINITSVQNIISKQYDISRLETIMSYLPKTIRSILIAIEILEKSHDCKNDLCFLLDYFYSHYQEKYDSSTISVQRILSALAHVDNGLNLAEIREKTKQENGKISPYLKLMSDQKIIQKEAKSLRGGIYSITDPLFKLWLQHNI